MPSVPRYDSTKVRDEAIPGVRFSPEAPIEAFGGGRAAAQGFEAGRDLIDDTKNIVLQEKKKADDLAFLDADLQASKLQTRLEIESKKMLGKNAAGAPDFVAKEWQEGSEEITKKLSNSEQRAAVDRALKVRFGNLDKTVQFHMADEFKRYDAAETEAYLATARDEAALNYRDPERIGLSIYQQTAALTKHADRNGLPSEWLKLKVADATSKTHSSVISRILDNGDDLAAKAYFDQNKQGLTGADVAGIEKALEEGSLRGESQRQADAIMVKAKDRTSALAMVTNIKEPKLRDEVERRVNQHFAQLKQIEQDQKEQTMLNATNIIEQTKDFDRVPPGVVAGLTVSERNSLRSYADNLREGKKPATDWGQYYELKTLASFDGTREKFLRMNLMEYRPTMADAEFKELVTLQTALRKGDGNADKELDGYRTATQIVNDTLASAGIDATNPKPGKDDAQKVAQFRRMVDEQIVVRQKQTGKKATNEEIQAIVDNLVVKGTVPGSGIFGFFQKERRAFELKDGEQIAIERKDIPARELTKIEAALRARNLPVTDAAIIELYNRRIQQMVK